MNEHPAPGPGDEQPADTPQLPLLNLLNAFLGLSDDTENACRLLILGPTGQFVADASLSARDVDTATKALTAAKALTEATRDIAIPGDTKLDAALEADLEQHCIGLDTDFLMDLAAKDPNSAVAAFDEITAEGEL
ncbi:hypothetical protein [Streptomyces alfalfae]